MEGLSISGLPRYSITFYPPLPTRPAFPTRHTFLRIRDYETSQGVHPIHTHTPNSGERSRNSCGTVSRCAIQGPLVVALVKDTDPPGPQHWVLVFIAPSWLDLLTRPVHTRAAWRATELLVILASHTHGLREIPPFPGFPKAGMRGQERYRTPPTEHGGAPPFLARENKFVSTHFISTFLTCPAESECVCGGGRTQNKIRLHLCPPVASGPQRFFFVF